jgi:hypothetical protein
MNSLNKTKNRAALPLSPLRRFTPANKTLFPGALFSRIISAGNRMRRIRTEGPAWLAVGAAGRGNGCRIAFRTARRETGALS